MGNLLTQYCFGGSTDDVGYDMLPTQDGALLVGTSDSNDGDVSGNHGAFDVWVIKLLNLNNDVHVVQHNDVDFAATFDNQKGNLLLFISSLVKGSMDIELLDISGKIILKRKMDVQDGNNKFTIKIGNLSSGVFIVKLNTQNGWAAKKIFSMEDN